MHNPISSFTLSFCQQTSQQPQHQRHLTASHSFLANDDIVVRALLAIGNCIIISPPRSYAASRLITHSLCHSSRLDYWGTTCLLPSFDGMQCLSSLMLFLFFLSFSCPLRYCLEDVSEAGKQLSPCCWWYKVVVVEMFFFSRSNSHPLLSVLCEHQVQLQTPRFLRVSAGHSYSLLPSQRY